MFRDCFEVSISESIRIDSDASSELNRSPYRRESARPQRALLHQKRLENVGEPFSEERRPRGGWANQSSAPGPASKLARICSGASACS